MGTDISGQRKCNKSALQWSLLSKKQAADTRVLVQIDWIDTWSFGMINQSTCRNSPHGESRLIPSVRYPVNSTFDRSRS